MEEATVWIESLGLDLKHVLRGLRSHKGFCVVCVLTFAIGIGINVAVFSSLDRLLFRSLPFKNPNQLTQVHLFATGLDDVTVAALTPFEITSVLRRRASSFDGVAFEAGWLDQVSISTEDRRLSLLPVSSNTLAVLGVSPVLGRGFSEADDDASSKGEVAVLVSDDTWRARFGGSVDVIGRSWRGPRGQYRVVGVLPKAFFFPSSRFLERVDGLSVVSTRTLSGARLTVAPVARLREGISVRAAQAELDLLAAGYEWETSALRRSATAGRLKVTVQPLRRGMTMIVGPYLWLTSSAVWLVLGIACLNLSILMIVRDRTRLQQIAVKAAIGASFGRLVRLSIIEAAVLCLCGAAMGWAASSWLQKWLVVVTPPTLRAYAVDPADSRVLLITLIIATACALVTALLPALALRRLDVLSVLRLDVPAIGSRVLRGGSALFMGVEAAFSVVVTAGAIVVVPGFVDYALRSPGFSPGDLFIVTANHNWRDVSIDDTARKSERARTIVSVINEVPGVQGASVAIPPLLSDNRPVSGFWVERGVRGTAVEVGAGYARVIKTKTLAGREFVAEDDAFARVAMLNETGARILWPDESLSGVIGRHIRVDSVDREIVGVLTNVRTQPGASPVPALFLPLGASSAQDDQTGLTVLVRMNGGIVPNARSIADRLNGRFPRSGVSVKSVAAEVDRITARPRFLAVLFGSMAFMAVLLMALGVYAVASVECEQRRREVAIRVALGASRWRIYSHMGFRVLWPAFAGGGVGVLLARIALQRLHGGVRELVGPGLMGYVSATSIVVLLTFVAVWWSAKRLATADPASVLRST